MAKKFSELWNKMSPERRAEAEARTQEMLAELGWAAARLAKIRSIAAEAPPTVDLVSFVERALVWIPLEDQSLEAEASPTIDIILCGRGFSLDAFKKIKNNRG